MTPTVLQGRAFSFSLRDVKRSHGAEANNNFMWLPAIPGVLFAQVVDVFYLAARDEFRSGVWDSDYALVTRISRDSGASWQPLIAPGCQPFQLG